MDLLKLLNLDLEAQRDTEIGELNDGRTGLKDWDWGDQFRSAITGISKEDIIEAAAQKVEKEINQQNSGNRRGILDATAGTKMGLTDEGLKIERGQTLEDYNAQIGSLQNTGTAILNATASTPGFDASEVGPGATASTVTSMQRGLVDKKNEEREGKIEQRDERDRSDRITQQQTINAQNERAQAFREHEASENRKERAYNEKMRALERQDQRADRKAELLMNREMKMLDRQYMRERDERADERAAKDKKTAMIAQMMKGLANLGGSFAL